jgi:leucyl-tRNA synthetase
VADDEPTAAELKSLHKLIKKVTYDIEHFSFNTSVSAFMICVNELGSLKCSKCAILQPFVILLSPFAPHLAEELWHLLGNNTTVCDAVWPVHNEEYLIEDVVTYVISFNGKARFNIDLPAGISREEAEKAALGHPNSIKWIDGKAPKKVIVVPQKIVNIVI